MNFFYSRSEPDHQAQNVKILPVPILNNLASIQRKIFGIKNASIFLNTIFEDHSFWLAFDNFLGNSKTWNIPPTAIQIQKRQLV